MVITNNQAKYYALDAIDIDESGELKPYQPVEPEPDPGKVLLLIELTDGLQKEYELTSAELVAFITWYDSRAAGNGSPYYIFNKSFIWGRLIAGKTI
ncbi:hypothetical protein P22_1718 [Propionispora sp. 2/2-37]|uniref:hypothetical protein n=1 Tax=Propionispora sp. 2/2-37 TaxID=1677858 RepID=UPI0006BB8880|nr:hypothetical protein [Propionispora sp. 2/2-37]CUH95644.1 hypothetical protein P22_1718 [Propionispora sp. 2/2-37]